MTIIITEHQIGQKIITMIPPSEAAPAVGDTGTITTYHGVDLATYEITRVDSKRRLIYGVIVDIYHGRI